MIGTAISAALALGSQIYGGYKSARANQQAEARLGNWYDRNYFADDTHRADAQRILQLSQEQYKNRNRAAQGRAAVMGATEEGVAATKQANSQALADAAAQIAASGAARKDAIDSQYNASKMANERQNAANIAAATSGAADAFGKMGGAIDEYAAGQSAGNTAGNAAGTVAGVQQGQNGAFSYDPSKAYQEEWNKQFGQRKGGF